MPETLVSPVPAVELEPDYQNPITIRPGERGRVILPWSEVCMFMRVADKAMDFELTEGSYPGVQLLDEHGLPFSGTILPGEAGVYQRDGEFYYYPPKAADPTTPAAE